MTTISKPLTGRITLTVAPPPHVHTGRTPRRMHLETIAALAPAAVAAVVQFGIEPLRVMALSIAVAVICEWLGTLVMNRRANVDDFHAVLMGLLFAFLMPAGVPWWLVVMGSASTILLGKMTFGGMGAYPLCPPLVGWAVLRVSWPEAMDVQYAMLNAPFGYPLAEWKFIGPEAVGGYSVWELLTGQQLAGLGAAHCLLLLLGGAFLLYRRWIRPQIPAGFLIGLVVAATIFEMTSPAENMGPLFHVLTGSTILGAFFLATDCSSSPVDRLPMLLYGLTAGALVMVIRVWGAYPDGVAFAILLANLLSPLFDRLRPRPLRGVRHA
jgi:electron transport complex protein RnfD